MVAVLGVMSIPALAADAGSEGKTAGLSVDQGLAQYKQVEGVSGSIKSIGSDTMNNLMTMWAEDFIRMYPNVRVEIEGKGSSTAPVALIAGTATFGPMSRAMKAKEIDDFEKKYGYKPTQLPTAIDMLAIYVHKDNPIQGLTMKQVDAIFSKTRKAGHATDVVKWGDLGLTGEWANRPISLYGRNSASGTYGYLKEHALQNGDYKDSVKEQPGSSAVVQAVATDLGGIGYSGIGYKTADVRAVPLAGADGKFVPAVAEHAYDGTYSLARFLYTYVNYKPGSQLDPLRREFVRLVFSREGQTAVIKDGYFPISAKIAVKALDSVGIGD
jgi:phosphate transport system substrate-binding protein